ncbi:hypothetical protein D1007_42721 [Hordeum vulgare]|nr:hypothetical protein D1007_42721 [Hordeum vulgare]
MEQSDGPKQPKLPDAADGDEDRLSVLPDDILIHILVKLRRTNMAARTSVLCRRWRGLWKLLPELDFPLDTETPLGAEPHRVLSALTAHEAPVIRVLVASLRDAAADSVATWLPIIAPRLFGVLSIFNLRLGDIVSSPRCPSLQKLFLRDAQVRDDIVIHSESLLEIGIDNVLLDALDPGILAISSDSVLQIDLKNLIGLRQLLVVAPALISLKQKGTFYIAAGVDLSQPVVNISAPQLMLLEWNARYDRSSVQLGKMTHLQWLHAGLFLVYGSDEDLAHNRIRLLQRFEFIICLDLALCYPKYQATRDLILGQIMDKAPSSDCTPAALANFDKFMGRRMLQVNALLVGNTILMGIMVGIGAYGHRHRHHPLTRYLFLGATILFLPIISYIASLTDAQYIVAVLAPYNIIATGNCDPVLLVQAIWTTYLGVNIMQGPNRSLSTLEDIKQYVTWVSVLVIFAPFALIIAKILFKYYAWYSARQSFAFGHSPCLIVGYMEQLPDRSQLAEEVSENIPPPLIITGEDTLLVEKNPHGYTFSRGDGTRMNSNGLVTIDKVWESDDIFHKSTAQLKDLCFSFALFKLLRCRFAKDTAAETALMKARHFFWHVLAEDRDGGRVFGLIAYELSFLHDYYYSSLPTSYSKSWLPILSISLSLLSIGYCSLVAIILKINLPIYWSEIAALVVLCEVRDIASYICSDWTKVALMCRCCSVTEKRRWLFLGVWFLFPSQRRTSIDTPTEVKTAIANTLRSSMGDLRNGMRCLQLGVQVGDNLLRACRAKGTSDALLAWHIATSIFEVRHPQSSPASDHKIVATHFSRYYAYLVMVAYSPELLPDDYAWSKSLYKATKEDAERVLACCVAKSTPELEYRQLVELLSARSKHEVLKDGAKLGEQLVGWIEGEDEGWKVLAGFWCEMILYIAPSDNLDGHAEAIARGGELLTLLWALLTHVGVVRRPEDACASTRPVLFQV